MPDLEKVSFNLSVVDLGQVDLLIDQGFYSSRTDFLVAAVRRLIQSHSASLKEAVARRSMTIGVAMYSRDSLEKVVASGQQLEITIVGVLVIADDVTPELACEAIKSVTVFGKFRAQPEVLSALLFRTKTEGSRPSK
jgi:Arc/MetJ-type ribon-helix-helix transcriptional regulator